MGGVPRAHAGGRRSRRVIDQDVPPGTRFAGYLRAIARGPGRGRSLTRKEAADAFGMVLDETAVGV